VSGEHLPQRQRWPSAEVLEGWIDDVEVTLADGRPKAATARAMALGLR